MPTTLGEKFDLSWQGKPPGMSREDYEIWKRYREGIHESYEGIYFNVHVGPGEDPGPGYDARLRAMWIQKTQLRIDVLIVYKDHVSIVELRDRATTSAIGRLLAYNSLFLDDDPFSRPIVLELVTNFYRDIMERLCEKYKIIYTVI